MCGEKNGKSSLSEGGMKNLKKSVPKGLGCIATWAIIFFLGVSPAVAKSQKLSFGLETRLRFESQNNFNLKYYGPDPPKGDASDGFLLSRVRAGFDYRPNETLHLSLWVQDARIWGSGFDDRDFYNGLVGMEHNPNEDRCELWETYLEIKNPFTLPLVVKAGRQRMFYGDKRVFGPGAWGNSGKWIWDVVKLTHPYKKGFVDVFYGRTMVHEPIQFSFNHR
ncbi:MAG: alginate export family protein, partial [Deltaproteobacteria bacterium]|nr:alginate export family protein [Deltaproteobacteria bacterium]